MAKDDFKSDDGAKPVGVSSKIFGTKATTLIVDDVAAEVSEPVTSKEGLEEALNTFIPEVGEAVSATTSPALDKLRRAQKLCADRTVHKLITEAINELDKG